MNAQPNDRSVESQPNSRPDRQSESRARIEQATGHTFNDPEIIDLALTHASVSDSRVKSNERLEFLGDAVLGLIACELIYNRYPDLLEGEMTKIKSTIVSRRTCARIAKSLDLQDLLVLGKGMRVSGARPLSLSAAALEAVIAAVYTDGGLSAAREFLQPHLMPLIEQAEQSGHQQNYKSVLQQHAQQNLDTSPSYRVADEQGPDHAKCFRVEVQIAAERFKGGWGQSKKQAEQAAALTALKDLGLIEKDESGHYKVVQPDGTIEPVESTAEIADAG